MFSKLYKFSKFVMYLNSCSMDLGRDNFGLWNSQPKPIEMARNQSISVYFDFSRFRSIFGFPKGKLSPKQIRTTKKEKLLTIFVQQFTNRFQHKIENILNQQKSPDKKKKRKKKQGSRASQPLTNSAKARSGDRLYH